MFRQAVFDYIHEEAIVVDRMGKGVTKGNRLQQARKWMHPMLQPL